MHRFRKPLVTSATAVGRRLAASSASYLHVSTDAHGHRIYKSHHRSVMKEVETHASFHDCFLTAAQGHTSDVAFIDGNTHQTVTYGEMLTQLDAFAGVLYHNFGIRKGSVVALLSPNTTHYAAVFQAIISLGAIVTTMNPTYTPDEVAKQIELSGATALITISPLKPLADAAIAKGCTVKVLLSDQPLPATPRVPASYRFKTELDDTIVLPFSSGTTGVPKGVQLTNQNLVANLYQTQEAIQFKKHDVVMSVLPFFHIYGLTVLLHGLVNVGGTQVVMPRFDMVQYLQLLEKYRATLLFVAPPMMVGFVKHPAVAKTDVSSVRMVFSGAAPLSEDIQRMNEGVFKNAFIAQGYGLTETSPVLTACPAGAVRYGTAGVPVSDTELRIVKITDESDSTTQLSGEDAPEGSEGELWARGPQIMKGYLRAEDSAKVFPEKGWFRTGDLARIDRDGFVTITERLKELIKYSGFQVAPAELEGIIQTHPSVQEAIVVGIPTEDGQNEVPRAQIVLKPTVKPEERDAVTKSVIDLVASKTASYKHLRGGVRVVDAVPKTASGKLLRRVVRAEELALLKKK